MLAQLSVRLIRPFRGPIAFTPRGCQRGPGENPMHNVRRRGTGRALSERPRRRSRNPCRRELGQAVAERLVLAKSGHENVSAVMTFREPVEFDDPRAVRKLVQLSSKRLALLSDSAACYGLGSIQETYDPRNEDLFEIRSSVTTAGDCLTRAAF